MKRLPNKTFQFSNSLMATVLYCLLGTVFNIMKYKVVKRMAAEFGRKAHVFVIAKKTWLGFYWDTDDYYFKEETAQKRCDELNWC